jgi:hypothetical protein
MEAQKTTVQIRMTTKAKTTTTKRNDSYLHTSEKRSNIS